VKQGPWRLTTTTAGNFNSELFDKLFRRLHLDGDARTNSTNSTRRPPPPTSDDRMDEIKQWLQANNYGIPVSSKGAGYKKKPSQPDLVAHL